MINKIIHFSVYNRGVVLLFTVLAALAGWSAFENLPIDAVPDITNVQVQVNSQVEGLAPEEIERGVTFPIEAAMSGIAGVEQVRSITRFGLSQVTVIFEEGTDIYRARQMVSERLQNASGQLPAGVLPRLGPVSTGLGEIFYYTLEAEKPAEGEERIRQLMEIRALHDWTVKPRLLTVKGVAEVNVIGGYEKQYHVQPRPANLARYGLRFSDLKEALERTNRNAGGGYVQQTGEQFLVQAVGLLKTPEEIRRVPIKSLETLKTVTIGDVAEVGLATELRTGAALVRGREAVLGSTLMLMGENSRSVSLRVAERLAEISKNLPPGYKLETVYDRSVLVNATLGTVEHNLVTGAALVIVILLLLLGNVRAALITAVTIPLTLLMTFVVMRWFGISGNLMSLGALDFGIIIDGAVIVLDNCVRMVHLRAKQLGRGLTGPEVQKTVYEAAVEIRTAAGFGELIIVVVFLPIFALVGIEGKMFVPMAATFCAAVLCALVLSFTTAPALASLLLKGDTDDKEPWLMRQVRAGYAPILAGAVRRRKWTVGIGLFAVVLGGLLYTRLGGEFLPQLNEGSLVYQFVRPVNISLDQSIAFQERSEKLLGEFSEVSVVFSRMGTAEVATDPMGVNISDTYVMLKDKKQWPLVDGKRRTKDELAAAMSQRLAEEIPGQRALASQPIEMRFNELLEGTRADIAIKVFGDDLDKLTQITKEITEIVGKVPGAGEVEPELRGKSPLLRVVPREGVLRTLGVSTLEVLETIEIALGGEEAGQIYEGVRRFPIIVRLSPADRTDLDAIRKLPVGIGANTTIPLTEAAEVSFTEAYGSVTREDARRRAAVLVNLAGRDTESFVREAQAAVEAKVKLPPGYYVEWGGNFKNLQKARSRLMLLTPVALILVLMMIYAAFKNVYETLLIFSCVPLALVGGVLGLMLNGLPFSISAGVGFIALTGIAVLNGVVLVHYFNDLRAAEGLSGWELVEKGTLIRLRPVLMTALVEIFGFLPMMLATGLGAEVQRPLASVVIGGVISSTTLTLLVLPTLYLMFERYMSAQEVEL
ncbi:MAG: CusA/CzcA family heavy metal efflux RND transporter [Elusimicrobiota bacterium]|nr:CusA/CzcA family heavy metal efflux RND transporter [Elusimicrobiota bacterium]